jgi:hypothetical protein
MMDFHRRVDDLGSWVFCVLEKGGSVRKGRFSA